MHVFSVLHFFVTFNLIRYILEFNLTRTTYLHLTYGLPLFLTKRKLVYYTDSTCDKIARVLYMFFIKPCRKYIMQFLYVIVQVLSQTRHKLLLFYTKKKKTSQVPGI